MIAMCLAVMIAGTDVAFAKVKAKKQSRKRAATTAVAPAANLDFRGVLTANIGKKYNTQLMRNLMNSSEFVERGGYASFKPQVERLAGDVTEHQLGGAQVLMLRFGDMRTPGRGANSRLRTAPSRSSLSRRHTTSTGRRSLHDEAKLNKARSGNAKGIRPRLA